MKWSWAGHINRLKDDRWTSRVTTWRPYDKKRRQWRPAKRWRDDLDKYWSDTIWQRTAQDRVIWRRHAEAWPNHGTQRLPNDDDDDDREAPPGTLAMISDSSYMNTDLFVELLEHFQVFVKPSQEDPVLLILDRHVSHCSLDAIDTSRKYNICLVGLLPHANHKLQPLDVGFFGPFKTAYSVECDNWIVGHHGRPITNYQAAGLFRAAYSLSSVHWSIRPLTTHDVFIFKVRFLAASHMVRGYISPVFSITWLRKKLSRWESGATNQRVQSDRNLPIPANNL